MNTISTQHINVNLEDIEMNCRKYTKIGSSIHSSSSYRSKSKISNSTNEFGEEEQLLYYQEEFEKYFPSSSRVSIKIHTQESKETNTNSTTETDDSQEHNVSDIVCYKSINYDPSDAAETFESHFIDVGSITFGGIFGLGEKTEQRVIMARNTVQCLLLPRFFLMDKDQNPENIWQQRLFCLNCMIPTREMLFRDYLENLKWKKFKSNFIKDMLIPNASEIAFIDDIPILCRIEAGIE